MTFDLAFRLLCIGLALFDVGCTFRRSIRARKELHP